ncbi:CLUMA_CG013622, isoform A [Clunio marinus]|uniref:CLUMA_CG013622, isoform A n=1 Tax=Clunio marinus TaxID=568069 RepID=A0A1J1ILB2_9DIPT|nr:CLUMA_CG013622, isoform A [Clunio marinus]
MHSLYLFTSLISTHRRKLISVHGKSQKESKKVITDNEATSYLKQRSKQRKRVSRPSPCDTQNANSTSIDT